MGQAHSRGSHTRTSPPPPLLIFPPPPREAPSTPAGHTGRSIKSEPPHACTNDPGKTAAAPEKKVGVRCGRSGRGGRGTGGV